MTDRKILEAGDLDRKQFQLYTAILEQWEHRDLLRLSQSLSHRKNARFLLSPVATASIAHLLDEYGFPHNNQIHECLVECVRGILLAQAHARYLEKHPLYTRKGNKYGGK